MTPETDLKPGYGYYTRDGREVEFVSKTADGRLLCSEILEFDTYDGTERGNGYLRFEPELFKDAPRHVVDGQILALEARKKELEDLNADLQRRALEAGKANKELFERLKKYNGLERLQDFIDGKITHVLVESYRDYEIKTLAEIEQTDDYKRKEGLRLISLFGKSNGDLQWMINRWRDGSGDWKRCQPCCSEEDAQTTRRAWVAEDLEEARAYLGTESLYWFVHACEKAVKYGVDLPADIAEAFKAEKERLLVEQRTKLEGEIAATKAKLAEIPTAA